MNESNEEIEDEDMFEFDPEDIQLVLEPFHKESLILGDLLLEEVCEIFKELFPPVVDVSNSYSRIVYEFSVNHIKELESHVLNNTLRGLVQDGLIDMGWDDDKQDFIFSAPNDQTS